MWVKQLITQPEEMPNDAASKCKKNKIKCQIRLIHVKRMFTMIKLSKGEIKLEKPPQVEVHVGGQSLIVNDPDEIAREFRDHNLHHFSQAHRCTLTNSEFIM